MDQKTLDEIISSYKNQFDELEEIKAENSMKLSNLSEEELASEIEKDLNLVLDDAKETNTTVAIIQKQKNKK